MQTGRGFPFAQNHRLTYNLKVGPIDWIRAVVFQELTFISYGLDGRRGTIVLNEIEFSVLVWDELWANI